MLDWGAPQVAFQQLGFHPTGLVGIFGDGGGGSATGWYCRGHGSGQGIA